MKQKSGSCNAVLGEQSDAARLQSYIPELQVLDATILAGVLFGGGGGIHLPQENTH